MAPWAGDKDKSSWRLTTRSQMNAKIQNGALDVLSDVRMVSLAAIPSLEGGKGKPALRRKSPLLASCFCTSTRARIISGDPAARRLPRHSNAL